MTEVEASLSKSALGRFTPVKAHPVRWSDPMQITGQVDCKWVVSGMQAGGQVECNSPPTIAGAIAKALAAYPSVLPIVGAECVIAVVYVATRPDASVSFL